MSKTHLVSITLFMFYTKEVNIYFLIHTHSYQTKTSKRLLPNAQKHIYTLILTKLKLQKEIKVKNYEATA